LKKNILQLGECFDGIISVSNSLTAFVSVGTGHACEHLNRMNKANSGLVSISNYANARQQFFWASLKISGIEAQFEA